MNQRSSENHQGDVIPIWKKAVGGICFAFVLTFSFLGVFEAILLGLDIGHSHKFYIEERLEDGTLRFRENRWFAHPYFSSETIRRPQAFSLHCTKGENELRIFVLGSSAAMGDPEASFSAGRMLERLFQMNYPELDVVVVNAAMTAINSHTVRRIARDCSELEPDAMILYEGNNEVIGPYGPTGVLSGVANFPELSDLMIFLRERRLSQLLLGTTRQPNGQVAKDWGGMQMFLDHRISFDDTRLKQVERQFRRNLEKIVSTGLEADCEVLLNTVLVNCRTFAPFQSESPEISLEDEDLLQFRTLVTQGDQALKAGKLSLAMKYYQQGWEMNPRSARLAYRIGRTALASEEVEQASEYLSLALELDTLRFRTSPSLNRVIEEVAVNHESDDRFLWIDAKALFEQASPEGIIGDEWLYEHVHLNTHANYQLARTWYLSLVGQWVQQGKLPEPRIDRYTYSDVCRSLGYTLYEQAMIAHELCNRFSVAPFSGQEDSALRLQQWQERARKLQEMMARPEIVEQIISVYQDALTKFPADGVLLRNYGMALCAFGEYELALPPLKGARHLLSSDPDLLYALAIAHRSLEHRVEFDETVSQLKRLEPGYPGLSELEHTVGDG